MLRAAVLLLVASSAVADPPRTVFGHALRVRPAGEKDFKKDTPKVGIEVIHDADGKALVYLTETGQLTATSFAAGKNEPADWKYGLDLRVRKAAEATFTKDTKKVSIEAFAEPVGSRLLYVTDAKTAAVAPQPTGGKTEGEPVFAYGLTLNVRGAGVGGWDKATGVGVEVYTDGNTGGLLFITETGTIATYPGPAKVPAGGAKGPKHLFGLDLKVRGSDESGFTKTTKPLAVEAFSDPTSGAILYVTAAGGIAAVPPVEVKSGQKPTWQRGISVLARKGGDVDFAGGVRYGIEAFRDGHTGYTIYAIDNGSIAAVK